MICPECNSENTVKNGHIHNGKQKFMCRECRIQFVTNPKIKLFLRKLCTTTKTLMVSETLRIFKSRRIYAVMYLVSLVFCSISAA